MNIFNSGVNEKIIKTDKVVYRTRTQEEYDWLMEKLEEAGCEWRSRSKLFDLNLFFEYSPYFAVRLKKKKLEREKENQRADIEYYSHKNYIFKKSGGQR